MYGSPGKHPIPSNHLEYCDNISCFVNGSLVTEVLPFSGVWSFLKATDSPGLQTRIVDLRTCIQGAGGPLHAVLFVGIGCADVPIGTEGVVVLKEAGCGPGS